MTVFAQRFPLAQGFDVALSRVGREGERVLTVEGALASPQSLIDYAAEAVAFKPAWGPHGGYPGLRAPAPLNYVEALVRALNPAIQRAFDLSHVKLARAECNFSIVVLGEEQLTPLQQIPHADTCDPLQFALLHYLCGPEHGGTAFYRHRATGYETLTPERQQEYEAVRARELAEQPPGYIRGDTAHYEQTAVFEAQLNRVLVYRSRTLHSGQIPTGASLDPEPRKGRLTANIFLNYRRA
jgi:hypothetical protein